MHVHTLGCHAFHDAEDRTPVDLFHFMRVIESVPEPLLKLLKAKCPPYFLDREDGFARPYLMNHCRCGARLDDDFLFGDIGAAFLPDTPGGYARMELFVLPIDEPMPMVSSFALGGGDYLDFDQVKPWTSL